MSGLALLVGASLATTETCPGGQVSVVSALQAVSLATRRTTHCAVPGTLSGDGTFSPLPIPPSAAAQRDWVAVRQHGDLIVGVLDSVIEAPAWEALVVTSADGGKTWTHQEVRKPYYMATITGLEHTAAGWEVRLLLEDDYGSGAQIGVHVSRAEGGHFAPFEHLPEGSPSVP